MMLNEILVGIIATLLLAILTAAIRHRRYLKIAINCYVLSRNKKIRVSMASILSIRREALFILIRNHHRPEIFGPIGGVYKYYPSAIEHLENCGFQPQIRDQDMKYDLRGFLVGKNLPCFLKWFFSGKNREIESVSRELIEEFKEIGLEVESSNIIGLQYDLLKKIIEGLDKVRGVEYVQIRYFEVYRLSSDNPKCNNITERLFREAGINPNIIAVTAEEISRGRARSGEQIAGNAGYLIGNSKINEPPPFYTQNQDST